MDLRIIRQFPISLQIVVLWTISLLNSSIFWALGSLISWMLWGINPFTDPKVLLDLSDPNVVSATRLLSILQNIGMFMVPAIIFVDITKYRTYFLGLNRPASIFLLLSVILMIVSFPALDLFITLNDRIVLPEWLGQEFADGMRQDSIETQNAILGPREPSGLWNNLFLVAVVPAVSEELFFRGALLRLISRSRIGWHGAIWLSALLFSVVHMDLYGALPRLLMGALFGYLVWWGNSIWVAMLAHFSWNAMILMLWAFDPAPTNPTYDWIWVSMSVVMALFILGLFYLRAKRPKRPPPPPLA